MFEVQSNFYQAATLGDETAGRLTQVYSNWERWTCSSCQFIKYKYKQTQVEKKYNNPNGYNMVHNVNKSHRNNCISTSSFFNLRLAKNFHLQIFLAVYRGIKQNKIPSHPWTNQSARKVLSIL